MRPVIFLAIDGVLAHAGSNEQLDRRCIAQLDRLIVHTRAKVLLTSAWRERHGVAGTEQRLFAAGFRGRLAGAIPSLPGRSRSQEIGAYLNTVARSLPFVILDHAPVDGALLPHLVHVDDRVGLTFADVSVAARLLGSPRRAFAS